MDIGNIIQIVLVVIFFVLSPLLRARQQKGQKKSGQPARPGQPQTLWGQQQVDYRAQYRLRLQQLVDEADGVLTAARASSLLERPKFAAIASKLVEGVQAVVDSIHTDAEAALAVTGLAQQRSLAQANEEIAFRLRRARLIHRVLADFSKQRSNPQRTPLLRQLDSLVEKMLVKSTRLPSRKRFVLIWDESATLPSSLLGDREYGFVIIPSNALSTAAGWAHLAQGIGFDLLAQYPDLLNFFRQSALVGAMAGRVSSPPFMAAYKFDLAAATGAWMSFLVADLVGAALLGQTYKAAVLLWEMSAGLKTNHLAFIQTASNQYATLPPLLLRLTALDALSIGASQSIVKVLGQQLALPTEALYQSPTRVTRRLMLEELLSHVREMTQALSASRPSQFFSVQLSEVLPSPIRDTDRVKIDGLSHDILADKDVVSSHLLLLGAGVEAELADFVASGQLRAHLTPIIRGMASSGKATAKGQSAKSRVNDRLMIRDALIRAEVL